MDGHQNDWIIVITYSILIMKQNMDQIMISSLWLLMRHILTSASLRKEGGIIFHEALVILRHQNPHMLRNQRLNVIWNVPK
jgi:hypothetical protein